MASEQPAPAPTPEQLRSRALSKEAAELREQQRWREALAPSFAAAELDPEDGAAALNLGALLTKMGRLEEGERYCRQALALYPGNPKVAHTLGHNLLAQGRLPEAWPFYAARALLPELITDIPRNFPFPRWRGESLRGKRIAIFPEQGYGDQIQFVRFVPQILAMGSDVMLLVRPGLIELFQLNFPDVEIVRAEGAVEFDDPDYWTTIYELPGLLGIALKELSNAPYLRAPTRPAPLGTDFKIGVKLKGNPAHILDTGRSLPDADAARLIAALPGTVISLEPQESGAKSFADTAAIIEQLDVVVSVDTSVAHLAGALGKSCLLLIPGFSPDWRWMVGRSDSPWYRRHRLYRSELDGNWTPAIDRLVADIRRVDTPGRRLMRDAMALREKGCFEQALALGRKALAADPKNPFSLHNVSRLLSDLGALAEGEKLQRRAVALAPDQPSLRYGLGLNLLAQGRYGEAWPLYEARTEIPSLNTGFPQRVRFPRWQGEDISGKRIAVFPEQGFGDQLQFARLLPWLRERGADIVLLTAGPLADLFRLAFPDITVVVAQGDASFPKSDVWTTIVDLARYADIAPDALPPGNYLERNFAAAGQGGEFRVGMMTRGNPAYIHDVHRSLPEASAAALRSALPGALVELDPEISGARNFLDTAHIIAGLDLVVSVDTSVGHLAGAMGKTCLLLVSGFATDWRWMRGRDDSPWYPAHRLFRSEIGDWDDAIRRLAGHAQTLAAAAALPS